jgi:hypothetical protein
MAAIHGLKLNARVAKAQRDVDLASLRHVPTTLSYLAIRLRCAKCD